MNDKRILVSFILIGFLFLYLFWFRPLQSRSLTSQASSSVSSEDFLKENVKASINQEDTPDHKIDVKYPQLIAGHYDSISVNSINSDIKKIVDNEINTFKLGYGEYNSATGEFVSLSDSSLSGQDSLYISFAIASLTDKLYSLEINTQTSFVNETAHPSHSIYTYNYDFVRNKQLKITDLLVSSNGLDKISSITLSKLDNNFREKWQETEITDWTKQGASPDPDNYKHFLIKKDGIEILFDEYQVASYIDGQPRIFLPFKEIRFLISPEYSYLVQ